MTDLFSGTPQTATSHTSTSTETPTWMQDAIFNQLQVARGVAATPYQQYSMPTVADFSDTQVQAFNQMQANQGSYKPGMDAAQSGMQGFSTKGTAGDLQAAQNQYLRQGLVDQNLNAGQNYFNRAGQMDIVGAAQPYMNQAGLAAGNIMGAAQPYMNQAGATTAEALSDRALNAANPYLQAASQSSAGNLGQYMSPYQSSVMDTIAKQGARNLSENLLPQVSDSFIKAGQFGSKGMGEFGSRAVRDTQEAILNQQSQLANQGYGQALSASQADLARQAQLAGTVGSISGADLSRVLQGGAQYGNLGQTAGQLTAQQASALGQLGQTAGQLTGQQMSQLGNLGQMQTTAGQAQQQFGLTAAQAVQQAQAQDYQRQMSALQSVASMAGQNQTMGFADTSALESMGLARQNQQQKVLTAAQQQYLDQQNYAKSNADWLNNQIRGIAGSVPTVTTASGSSTGATYSPSVLSQLATAGATGAGLYNMTTQGSDIRIKENIERVGELPNGLGIYDFDYKTEFKDHPLCGHGRFRGVMAHEVAKLNPKAVVPMGNGYNAVKYDLINA